MRRGVFRSNWERDATAGPRWELSVYHVMPISRRSRSLVWNGEDFKVRLLRLGLGNVLEWGWSETNMQLRGKQHITENAFIGDGFRERVSEGGCGMDSVMLASERELLDDESENRKSV